MKTAAKGKTLWPMVAAIALLVAVAMALPAVASIPKELGWEGLPAMEMPRPASQETVTASPRLRLYEMVIWSESGFRLPQRRAIASAYAETRVWGFEFPCPTYLSGNKEISGDLAEGACKYLYGYANPTVFVDPTGRVTVLKNASGFLGELRESLIDQAADLNTAPAGEGFFGRTIRKLRAAKSGVAAGVTGVGQQIVDLTNTAVNAGIVLDKVQRGIDQGDLLHQAVEELGTTVQNVQQTAQVVGEDPFGVAAEIAIAAEEVTLAAARGDTRAIAQVSAFGTELLVDVAVGGKGLGAASKAGRLSAEFGETVLETAARASRRQVGDITEAAARSGLRLGDRLPGGRVVGVGPGAALKNGPEFGGGQRGVSNSVPRRMARVIEARFANSPRLGGPGAQDVFVTSADDIAGIGNSSELALRLTLLDDAGRLRQGPFAVIEFDTPVSGVATPVFRTTPGFVQGGRTAGGAVEFVLPNLKVQGLTNVTVRILQ